MTAPEQPVTGALTEDERKAATKAIISRYHRGGIETNETGLLATIRHALDEFNDLLAARSHPPAERAGGEAVAAVICRAVHPHRWGWDVCCEPMPPTPTPCMACENAERNVRAALSTGTAARDEAVVKAEEVQSAEPVTSSGGVVDLLAALQRSVDAAKADRAAALSEQPTTPEEPS